MRDWIIQALNEGPSSGMTTGEIACSVDLQDRHVLPVLRKMKRERLVTRQRVKSRLPWKLAESSSETRSK